MLRRLNSLSGCGACVLVWLSASATAPAQFGPAWTWNRAAIGVYTSGAITTTRGIEFTVSEPVVVTALGTYDEEWVCQWGPGLLIQHEMALWDVANPTTPLATGTVLAATATDLCQDGYRYAQIAPTTLTPGHSYVLAVYWPGSPFDCYPDIASSAATVTYDPRITTVIGRWKFYGNPFEFPNQGTAGVLSFIGMMNLRIGPGQCEPNAPADLITTFAGGNGQAGNMFDLKATNPAGLTVDAWQLNLNDEVTNGTPVEVSIYWREGTYAGHTSSPDGWNLLGTLNVLSWGTNRPTPVPLGGLALPYDQTVGVFITTKFITGQPPPLSPPFLNYSNIPPASTTYSNADLLLSGGVGKANPLFTGTTFANKMWNGGILYSVGTLHRGDLDCDGVVNAFDIDPFVVALTNPTLYQQQYPNCNILNGDINKDGVVNAFDIDPFVVCLTLGACP